MSEGLVEGQGDASVLEEGHGILCARKGESRERERERPPKAALQGIHKAFTSVSVLRRPMLCSERDKNRLGFHKCLGSQPPMLHAKQLKR